jgi:hypothetical protein
MDIFMYPINISIDFVEICYGNLHLISSISKQA